VALAAAAAGLALAQSPAWAPAGAALAAAALASLRAPVLGFLAALVVLGGSAAGQLRLAAIDAPAERVRGLGRVEVRAHLLTAPRAGPFGSSAEARVVSGRLGGVRLLLRAPAWAPFPRALSPGREVVAAGRLLAPGGRAPGHAAHLRRRGVAAELALERVRPTGRSRGGLAGALDRTRARAERAVSAGMAPAHAALLRGMVLGQDEDVEATTREDFRRSGLAHLLSDQHLDHNAMTRVAAARRDVATRLEGPSFSYERTAGRYVATSSERRELAHTFDPGRTFALMPGGCAR
jgi:predicted membrane metal-binding protein